STEKGILVTLLHYVNVVDPKSFTLTGMTRGGTFLIENGKIVKGVKNLRFTQSMFEALGEVEGISREREVVGTVGWYHIRFPYGTLMPAIKVKKFKFTGKTEF
ncbi:MAG: TldD/PmbA family protein, partial [Candidatus Hydrothermota bacterium]